MGYLVKAFIGNIAAKAVRAELRVAVKWWRAVRGGCARVEKLYLWRRGYNLCGLRVYREGSREWSCVVLRECWRWSRAGREGSRYMFAWRHYMLGMRGGGGGARGGGGGARGGGRGRSGGARAGSAGTVVEERSELGLVTVDVGLHGLALAHWAGGELSCAWYQPASEKGRGAEAWRRLVADVPAELDGCDLLVETMVHYEGSRVRPADLLELQAVCGALVAARAWAAVENVEARTWTDNIPKDVRHARLERLLETRGWTDRIERPKAASRMSDVYDAVGLGLWRLESRSTKAWSWRGGAA